MDAKAAPSGVREDLDHTTTAEKSVRVFFGPCVRHISAHKEAAGFRFMISDITCEVMSTPNDAWTARLDLQVDYDKN